MRPVTDRLTTLVRRRGFTLMEMVISLTIGAVLVAITALFVSRQIDAYLDVTSRAGLADAADTALRRMSWELREALPNSVRVSGNYLEFIPIAYAGRYRAEYGIPTPPATTVSPLDFGPAATATQFDVLGPSVDVSPGSQIVIYNLGLGSSDAYAGGNRRTPIPGSNLASISAATAFRFPFASPANRFHIVNPPVTFECDPVAGVIRRRAGYGFLAAQPVAATAFAGGSSAILIDNLAPGGCAFVYDPGVLTRNGLVSMRLNLAANGETVALQQQVEVFNTP